MAIVFLGPKESAVYRFLKAESEPVTQTADPVSVSWLREHACDFIVSHGYRHVVRKDVIEAYSPAIINLHIGYLPWGGGADPNLWSFLEETPAGVTIHVMDEGVDAGPILLQEMVEMDAGETLATSYEKLQIALNDMFCRNWSDLRRMSIPARPQQKGGTAHRSKDKEPFLHLIEARKWDTPVAEIRGLALKHTASGAKTGPLLLVRADAGSGMGTGHVMRCLALAQAWQSAGGQCAFAVSNCPPSLRERLKTEDMNTLDVSAEPGQIEDVDETVALAKRLKADWVIADGYHLHPELSIAVRASGLKILVFDDYGHSRHYDAQIVLNQNLSADPSVYGNRRSDTRLLMGPKYASLRREFRKWRGWKREITAKARKVLVTMGGEDPHNVTLKVLQALRSLHSEHLEVHVIVGPLNPRVASLQQVAADSGGRLRILSVAQNMPSEMAWADIAISAAGSTCWELAFMGLPSLLIVLAENQSALALAMERAGVAVSVGDHVGVTLSNLVEGITSLMIDPQSRMEMSRRGQSLVDGAGAERIVALLKELRVNESCVKTSDT